VKKQCVKICKNERSFEKIQITVLNDEKAILGVFFNKPYIATLGRKKASKKPLLDWRFLEALFVFFIIFLTFWLLKRKKHVKLHKNTKSLENQKSFFENARSPLPPSDPPSPLFSSIPIFLRIHSPSQGNFSFPSILFLGVSTIYYFF
jgi:hypothetical protein